MSEQNRSGSGESDHYFVPPSPLGDTDYRHARLSRSPLYHTRTPAPHQIESLPDSEQDPRRIVVVGVCSAGKSTLVRKLREKGYKARACAQEHSGVPHLWQRQNPDLLVYLDASIHTIRRRRGAHWEQPLLDAQHKRLAHACEHCDLYIDTNGLSPDDLVSRAVTFLQKQ